MQGEEPSMTKHDAARRAFLVRAAVGAGAVAGAGFLPDATAETQGQHGEANASAAAQSHPNGDEHGAFFNYENAAMIAAFTERLMPGAPGKPGARDAGVLNYIDLALAGAYADLQDFYRRGLAQLDAYCRKTFNQPFLRLAAQRPGGRVQGRYRGTARGVRWRN